MAVALTAHHFTDSVSPKRERGRERERESNAIEASEQDLGSC